MKRLLATIKNWFIGKKSESAADSIVKQIKSEAFAVFEIVTMVRVQASEPPAVHYKLVPKWTAEDEQIFLAELKAKHS